MRPIQKNFLVRIKGKYQLTIPSNVREQIDLKVGDIMEAVVYGKTIMFTPKTLVSRDDVRIAINEGLEDIRKRRTFGPFGTMKEFKAALKKL